MSLEDKKIFAEKMRAQFPSNLNDGGAYIPGVSERYEDLLAVGDTRDLSIWRETHEQLESFKHLTEYEFLPTYSELHNCFIDEIFHYCRDKDIDIQFHTAPCNMFFNRDYSQKYAIVVRTLPVCVSPELQLAEQGKQLASGLLGYLSEHYPNWNLLTLYCISNRKGENLYVRFGGLDTKNLPVY